MQDEYILTSLQPFKRECFVSSGFCGRKATFKEEALVSQNIEALKFCADNTSLLKRHKKEGITHYVKYIHIYTTKPSVMLYKHSKLCNSKSTH